MLTLPANHADLVDIMLVVGRRQRAGGAARPPPTNRAPAHPARATTQASTPRAPTQTRWTRKLHSFCVRPRCLAPDVRAFDDQAAGCLSGRPRPRRVDGARSQSRAASCRRRAPPNQRGCAPPVSCAAPLPRSGRGPQGAPACGPRPPAARRPGAAERGHAPCRLGLGGPMADWPLIARHRRAVAVSR